MKTLFGERKSVKTLAFILALALILPLLPVMSVVGADAKGTIESVLFKNAYDGTGGQENWADVYFTSPNGQIDIAAQLESSSSSNNLEWSSNQKVDLAKQQDSDARDAKLTFNSTMSSARPKRSLQFAIAPETSKLSEYVIHLSYKDAEGQPKDVELSPVNGLYTIDVVTHASEDGNYTVQAKAPTPTYTLTFPERRNVSGYTITKASDGTCYGEQTVKASELSTSFEFTIKVNDPTDVPVVRVIWEDDSEASPELESEYPKGNEYKYKVDNITKDGEVVIELHPAVSISYSPAPGTAANSFTISGIGNNGDLYSAPYNTKEFKFTVNAAAGYEITDVKLGSESIVDEEPSQEAKKDTKNCTIKQASITKDLTVFVTTEAITPNVKLDGSASNCTVSGITPAGRDVPYNSSITFYVTPDPGYDSLTVKYTMTGKVVEATPVPHSGNVYTIDEITGDVTVTINSGDIAKLCAELVADSDQVKTDNSDVSWAGIDYGTTRTFKVAPEAGYKVTSITVRSGNTILTSNTYSNSIYVSNITSNLRIEVTTEPITITVNVKDGGNLNGIYVFKYGESGFEKEWIDWVGEEGPAFQTENITNLIDQIKTLSGTSAVTRFGFKFDDSQEKGWFISAKTFSGKNADATITLAGNWIPVLTELFVLKTEVIYDPGLDTLSFVSRLVVSDSADDEAKAKYGSALVKVNSYGVFYGQYATSLNDDTTLLENVEKFIDDYKDQESMTKKNAKQDLWGNINKGQVYFYSTNRKLNPAEFQVSGNTITETFQENEQSSQRSGITWVEIEIEGYTDVIIGPATQYLGA